VAVGRHALTTLGLPLLAKGEHFILQAELDQHPNELGTQLSEFYAQVQRGQLRPHLRSEEVPSPDESNFGVERLVGSTFESSVLRSDTPVLVLFSLPGRPTCSCDVLVWCNGAEVCTEYA
jgi:hypothetical protein